MKSNFLTMQVVNLFIVVLAILLIELNGYSQESWTATTSYNAPSPRVWHTAVWTGSKMIVWGGASPGSGYPLNTGGIYDPSTNNWSATTLANAPAARVTHTAIWTGDKMVVWGGTEINGPLNSGGIYYNFGVIGIKNSGTEIPKEFSLSQNYPNPFNPSTKIKFEIPLSPLSERGVGGFVTLKIYDLLGREVATLVNEQLQPGKYEVDFDGTNYPSGVYIYRLQSDTFTDSRKMILLK
jgi:hypothetical protein